MPDTVYLNAQHKISKKPNMNAYYRTLIAVFVLSSMGASAYTNAAILNTFDLILVDDSGGQVGVGNLTFETDTPTGTFALEDLNQFSFFMDIDAPTLTTSGFFDPPVGTGEREEIILEGVLGSRSITINDPNGSNTPFSGGNPRVTITHNDNSDRFGIVRGTFTNISWITTDTTSVSIPEPTSLVLLLFGSTCCMISRRLRILS